MSAVRCPSCGALANGVRFCGTCGMRLAVPGTSPAPSAPSPTRTTSFLGFAPLTPGTLLDRRYRILTALAAGSMGAVYRAEDLRLGGRVRALKELLQHWGTQEERAEAEIWFRREGETLMSLQHPAIPLVHDTFSEGARHYLVMDLVEGRSLEQVLAEEGRPGLPEERVLRWADEVLDVLSYLHSRSDPLIFRDLKPANVMLTPGDQIRLIDFGIARVFTQQAQGTAIGTPGYAPPEQYQGLAEPASDLYALGATMHHLLTGRDPRKSRPFDFPAVRGVAPQISAAVAGAVDRSLSVDPRARPGTAAEMRKALHATGALDGSVKRSVSGSLSLRPSTPSGSMPALPSKTPVPAPVDPASMQLQVGARAVKVRPHDMQIAVAGNRTLTRIDRRTVRIRNRTKKRIHCTFSSDVPWLRPDRPADWLEPHGQVEIALSVTWADPPVGAHRGALQVIGGGQTWAMPVRLQVGGVEQLLRQNVMMVVSRLASLCLAVGVVATVLNTFSIHLMGMGSENAWHVLVGGLVAVVLLGAVRAARGH